MERRGLAVEILPQVRAIEPSTEHGVAYYPCQVRLRDGAVHPRVYLVDAEAYARGWGLLPNRRVLSAEDVVAVEPYPERLPVRFANELYEAGESGMGYCLFVLRFHDGHEQAYLTGNAVDFLPYPSGYTASNVVGVQPHAGREAPLRLEGLSYEWCPAAGLRALSVGYLGGVGPE